MALGRKGLSQNISHLGVRVIKSHPSFRPPYKVPLIGVSGGEGTPQRKTQLLFAVKSFPKSFDSLGIKIILQS